MNMRFSNTGVGEAGMGLVVLILIWLISVVVVCSLTGIVTALTLPYTVNTWLEVAGKDPAFTMKAGFFCGLFPPVATVSVVACLATYIIQFFI